MNSHQLNCAVNPVLFCERAGPLIGTTHESLKRATSLCSETAINDKQETLKMSHGEDEKTTFLCCSRKQTFLVVPHIKLPLTQILTHIQTRSDESWLARGCFLYLSPVIFVCLQREIYSHPWMCRRKRYRVIKGYGVRQRIRVYRLGNSSAQLKSDLCRLRMHKLTQAANTTLTHFHVIKLI